MLFIFLYHICEINFFNNFYRRNIDSNKELQEWVSLLQGTAHLSNISGDEILTMQNMQNIYNTNSVSNNMWKTFSNHNWTAKAIVNHNPSRHEKRIMVDTKVPAVTVDGFMRMIKQISAPW